MVSQDLFSSSHPDHTHSLPDIDGTTYDGLASSVDDLSPEVSLQEERSTSIRLIPKL